MVSLSSYDCDHNPSVRIIEEAQRLTQDSHYHYLPYDEVHLLKVCKEFLDSSISRYPNHNFALLAHSITTCMDTGVSSLTDISVLCKNLDRLSKVAPTTEVRNAVRGLGDLLRCHIKNVVLYDVSQSSEREFRLKYQHTGDAQNRSSLIGLGYGLGGASSQAKGHVALSTQVTDTGSLTKVRSLKGSLSLGFLSKILNTQISYKREIYYSWLGLRKVGQDFANKNIDQVVAKHFPDAFTTYSAKVAEQRAIANDATLKEFLQSWDIGKDKTIDFHRYNRPYFFTSKFHTITQNSTCNLSVGVASAKAKLGASITRGNITYPTQLMSALKSKNGFLYLHDDKVKEVLKYGPWSKIQGPFQAQTAQDIDSYIDSLQHKRLMMSVTKLRSINYDAILQEIAPRFKSFQNLQERIHQSCNKLDVLDSWLKKIFHRGLIKEVRLLKRIHDKVLTIAMQTEPTASHEDIITQASQIRTDIAKSISQQAKSTKQLYRDYNRREALRFELRERSWVSRVLYSAQLRREISTLNHRISLKFQSCRAKNIGEYIRNQAICFVKSTQLWERTFLHGSSSTKTEEESLLQQQQHQDTLNYIDSIKVVSINDLHKEAKTQKAMASHRLDCHLSGSIPKSDFEKKFEMQLKEWEKLFTDPQIFLSDQIVEQYLFVRSQRDLASSKRFFETGQQVGFFSNFLNGKAHFKVEHLHTTKGDLPEKEGQYILLTCELNGNVHDYGLSVFMDSLSNIINKSFSDEAWSSEQQLTIKKQIEESMRRHPGFPMNNYAAQRWFWEFRIMEDRKIELVQFRPEYEHGVSASGASNHTPISIEASYKLTEAKATDHGFIGQDNLVMIMRKVHGFLFANEFSSHWPEYAKNHKKEISNIFKKIADPQSNAAKDYKAMIEQVRRFCRTEGGALWSERSESCITEFEKDLREFVQDHSTSNYQRTLNSFSALCLTHFNTDYMRQIETAYHLMI